MSTTQASHELRDRLFHCMLEASFSFPAGVDQELTLEALIEAAGMLQERFRMELDELRQEAD